ncbi:MAG: gamma-glutamylcyclotransferase [Candidatus Hydrogenedentes bacterium]|nr:gamma-glutamylcyclotransferase [Candidatus Hydrogenedentota bacterium]
MRAEQIFVYGTLMDASIQRRILGRTAEARPGTLHGYRKTMVHVDGQGFPNIEAAEGHAVNGLILSVDTMSLAALDAYEGAEYQRRQVLLADGKIAWVYIAPGA